MNVLDRLEQMEREAAESAEAGWSRDPVDAEYIAVLCNSAEALIAVARAAQKLCDDEESGVVGFGPDITHIVPLRAALGELEEPDE